MRPLDEIENELLAIEQELAAMAGYEDQYPEHYEKVKNDYDRLLAEYDRAQSEIPQSTQPPEWSFYDDEDTNSSYDDEVCELPVSGDEDSVCLIDPDPEGDNLEYMRGIPQVERVGLTFVDVGAWAI